MAEQNRTPRAKDEPETEQDRTPRAADTREAEEAPDYTWTAPELLPEPEKRSGWVHRWVRTSIRGEDDARNVSMRMREGWEPCEAKDYPEMISLVDRERGWGAKGCIEVGGLLLCRAPEEKMAARDRAHHQKAEQQLEAVDSQLLSNSDARMPIQQPQRRTTVTFGRGGPTTR